MGPTLDQPEPRRRLKNPMEVLMQSGAWWQIECGLWGFTGDLEEERTGLSYAHV